MTPTILVVGATGNTGKKVAESLPQLLKKSKTLSGYRILCLTRSLESEASKKLSQIAGIEIIEQNWVDIDVDWLKRNVVKRAFIAAHYLPTQFAEESQFHVNCLRAGVEYVVRISTTAKAVRPDSLAYYQRAHWAIEAMLSSPAYEKLGWSSLQPNVYSPMALSPAAEFIKEYRKTGKQGVLSLAMSSNTPIALLDSDEVGLVAAHLIASDDYKPYNHKKLVINGPEEITGLQVVKLVEKHIGTKVEEVEWLEDSSKKQKAAASANASKLMLAIADAILEQWHLGVKDLPTSREVLDLCPPKRTAAQVLQDLLQ